MVARAGSMVCWNPFSRKQIQPMRPSSVSTPHPRGLSAGGAPTERLPAPSVVAGHLEGARNAVASMPRLPVYRLAEVDAWERAGGPGARGAAAQAIRDAASNRHRRIDLGNLGLTDLPPLPDWAETLVVNGNPLDRLPPLPSRLDRGVSSRHTAEARPLGDAAAAWYPSSSRAERCAAWGAFADESGAQAFSSFLDALNGSPWGRSHAFARDMRAWLERLASPGNDALRRTTFAISLDATQTCRDRALYALYGMRMHAVLADVEAGRYDRRAGTVVALARSFQAFEAMTRVAQRIVDARVDATGAVAGREEEIEVYLALVQAFERVLPPMLRDAPMLYEASAELSAGDRAVAARELEALAPAFPRFLCNWEPLANALKRWHPTRYEGSDALLRDKIDNGDFEAYQRAHGFAGTAALEALRHEVFLPLVGDYLKVHGVDAAFLAPVEVTRF